MKLDKSNFYAVVAAHSLMCDHCINRLPDTLAWIPLFGMRRWKAYLKMNRVANYLMGRVKEEYAILESLAPDETCPSCEIGPDGHEFDCPEAQI